MGRILQRLRFQSITRTLKHVYPQRFVFQRSAQVLITALRLSTFNFAPNKSNKYESYIQDRVLRERKQGEERSCPHHGASDHQRDYRAVQLQADHPKDTLGCQGQPRQRQEQGGAGGERRT